MDKNTGSFKILLRSKKNEDGSKSINYFPNGLSIGIICEFIEHGIYGFHSSQYNFINLLYKSITSKNISFDNNNENDDNLPLNKYVQYFINHIFDNYEIGWF